MEEELLFGKYKILRILANGSGGEVFLTEHTVLGERRIVKRLYKNRPFYRERLREAHILKKLHHAAIPCIYDIEEDATASYIIEEDMGGEPLNEVLSRQKCLPTSFISHYSIQLCEIIDYLHKVGVLYLDVKPENLMISGDRLSLIDFGGAMKKEGEQRVLFGTDGYAAPEQYLGYGSERSDVYGIGRVIGVMLEQGNKKEKELLKIYKKCVQSLPENRYRSVSELKEELERLCCGKRRKTKSKPRQCPRYIGVTGVHEGVDTAAISTLLAGHFKEHEKGRIACIDMSGRKAFQKLYESLYGRRAAVPDEFSLRGICYITGSEPSVIGACAVKDFTVTVINFGTFSASCRGEFFRCDKRFAVGDLYPWRHSEWVAFGEDIPEEVLQHGITALIGGGEAETMPLGMGRVYYLPQLRDVLYADRKSESFFHRLL